MNEPAMATASALDQESHATAARHFRLHWIRRWAPVILLAPFLLLSFFSYPAADDFSFTNKVNAVGFIASQVDSYHNCTGRYFYTALMSSYAGATQLRCYWIVPLALLLGLCAAFYAFTRSITAGLLPRRMAFYAGLLLLCLYVCRVPEPSSAFYWLAGAANYQVGNILMILTFAAFVHVWRRQNGAKPYFATILACLLMTAAVGCNETCMLLIVNCVVLGCFCSFLTRDRRRFHWLIVLAITGAAAAIVAFAPGNKVRLTLISTEKSFDRDTWKVVVATLRSARLNIGNWLFDSANVGASLMFLPVACFLSRRLRALKERRPWLILIPVGWFLSTVLAFLPEIWAKGLIHPRNLNTIYVFFLIGWYATLAIAVAFLFTSRQRRNLVRSPVAIVGLTLFVASLVLAGNFPRAYSDLFLRAFPYHREMVQRSAIIAAAKAEGEANVVVPPLRVVPKTIHFSDITEEADHWENVECATFHGLKSIRLSGKQ